jgi:hypothetical protein
MLAAIALVTLSATGAQAGAGGNPSPLTSFFVCKSINGDDAARRVDVDSIEPGAGWGFNLQNVRIGNATLACAFARLFPGGSTQHIKCVGPNDPVGCNEISPNPSNVFNQLKCYTVSTARGQTGTSQPTNYSVNDQLFPGGTDSNVAGSSLQYICAPASFTETP